MYSDTEQLFEIAIIFHNITVLNICSLVSRRDYIQKYVKRLTDSTFEWCCIIR